MKKANIALIGFDSSNIITTSGGGLKLLSFTGLWDKETGNAIAYVDDNPIFSNATFGKYSSIVEALQSIYGPSINDNTAVTTDSSPDKLSDLFSKQIFKGDYSVKDENYDSYAPLREFYSNYFEFNGTSFVVHNKQ